MHVYRIENIRIEPLVMIADDFDHAAILFLEALREAFNDRPVIDFAVTKWNMKPGPDLDIMQRFADQGHRGIVWSVDDGCGWEMVLPPDERD